MRLIQLSALGAATLLTAHPTDNREDIQSRQVRELCASHTNPEFFTALAGVAVLDAGDLTDLSNDRSKLESAVDVSRIISTKSPKPLKSIRVKTYVHVVAASKNLTDGWIPDSQVKAQLRVLNNDFGNNPHT